MNLSGSAGVNEQCDANSRVCQAVPSVVVKSDLYSTVMVVNVTLG